MESAFKNSTTNQIHRLIAHEKAHFLWHYTFDKQLKQDWTNLGGWYKTENNEWRTSQQVEFVTSYAHGISPNEDMAESISFYIINPDNLRSIAPKKYEFIRNRIMHGSRYISKIREDLTFKVYNLWPDYIFPGRVVKSKINIVGEPDQDKQVEIVLTLHSENELDYASSAHMRIESIKGTFIDILFYPINTNGDRVDSSNILKADFTMSKFAATGHWTLAYSLVLRDLNGNRRYTHDSDFGWNFYLNNPLADYDPPEYVFGSMKMSLRPAITQNGRSYQILKLEFDVKDDNPIYRSSVSLVDDNLQTYSVWVSNHLGKGTKPIETPNGKIIKITLEKQIPDYMPNGIYKVSFIRMVDIAENITHINFKVNESDSNYTTDKLSPSIEITTPNPDLVKPEMDINNISVNAQPVNLNNLNGETIVIVNYSVRDDNSGYGRGYIKLRDPNGKSHGFYIILPQTWPLYFEGDPTVYKEYTWSITLPEGSTPGIWGISEMDIIDKAQNKSRYNFTEIIRFDVDGEMPEDLNADGTVNIQDLVIVANNFGNERGNGDVNGDGVVNILDMVQVSNAFSSKVIE